MTESYRYLVPDLASIPRRVKERPRHRGRGVVVREPGERRVSFYCAERSHESDPWFAASFIRVEHDGYPPRWVADRYYPIGDGHGFWIGNKAAASLVGNSPVGKDVVRDAVNDPAFRVRYSLDCELCGLRCTRKADEMNADLDTLWAAGVLEVSIRAFAAIVN